MSSKSVKLTRFGLVLGILGVAGCAIMPGAREPIGERVSGRLGFQAGQLLLHTCNGAQSIPVSDTGTIRGLIERMAPAEDDTLFLDMIARSSGGELAPMEVIRLQTTDSGCSDTATQGSHWVALGGEPAWQLRIGPSGMQWQDNEGKPIPVITEEVPGSVISFQALRGETQEVWISPEACFGQESGDYFHRTARVIRDGSTLTGCAYQGLLR